MYAQLNKMMEKLILRVTDHERRLKSIMEEQPRNPVLDYLGLSNTATPKHQPHINNEFNDSYGNISSPLSVQYKQNTLPMIHNSQKNIMLPKASNQHAGQKNSLKD